MTEINMWDALLKFVQRSEVNTVRQGVPNIENSLTKNVALLLWLGLHKGLYSLYLWPRVLV